MDFITNFPLFTIVLSLFSSVLCTMFSVSHDETDPHRTRISRPCFRNRLSHATLRSAANVRDRLPIHEISSSSSTVHPSSEIALSASWNA